MGLSTIRLHKYLIDCLGDSVVVYSDLSKKPLCVQARMPDEQKLRIYLFNCSNPPGGRPFGEYKSVLNVGQPYGSRGNFDFSGGYIVLLMGYVSEYDVFVFWDAMRHMDFGYNKNLQVQFSTILGALANELAFQTRRTRYGQETVIAARAMHLKSAIRERINVTIRQIVGD